MSPRFLEVTIAGVPSLLDGFAKTLAALPPGYVLLKSNDEIIGAWNGFTSQVIDLQWVPVSIDETVLHALASRSEQSSWNEPKMCGHERV